MDKNIRSVLSTLKSYVIITAALLSAAIIFLMAAIFTNLSAVGHINEAAIKAAEKRSILLMCISIGIIFLSLVLLVLYFAASHKKVFYPVGRLYSNLGENINLSEGTNSLAAAKQIRNRVNPGRNNLGDFCSYDRLNSLIDLISNLNKNLPFKEILSCIYRSFSTYVPYTHIGVALIDCDSMTARFLYEVSDKKHSAYLKSLLGCSVELKDTSLLHIISSGKERVINDLEEYVDGKPIKEYNKILLNAGIRSSVTFPLKNNDTPVGIVFFSSDTKYAYKNEHIESLRILADAIMLGLEKSILFDDMIVGSIQALAKLAEQRDPETGEHLIRMSKYSRLLAELLSCNKRYCDILDEEYINNIEKFTPLHDIGKVGIRDDILLKWGRLSPDEFEVMKTHTIYGAWVLKNAEENLNKRGRSIFKMGIEIAEGHHEKWNGTGYPYGTAGGDIPLSARIVAVADVFDALTSKRPYRSPLSFDESCKLIIDESGKHFDPDIAELFIAYNDKIRSVYGSFKKSGLV